MVNGNLLAMRKRSKGFKEYIIHKLNKFRGMLWNFKKNMPLQPLW